MEKYVFASSVSQQFHNSNCNVCSGYLAPEYMCHGQLSEKADVYSFGILLLEIVSGKRNRVLTVPEDEMFLPTRVGLLNSPFTEYFRDDGAL